MMNKKLIANLTEIDEIELIYETHLVKKNETHFSYTIICDIDNIVSKESLMLCKKIIATMSIIQELLSKYNIIFSYTIKASKEFEREISENRNDMLKEIKISEILYSKNHYFEDFLEESKHTPNTKRA